MSDRNFSIRSLNSGSRKACWNNSLNPAGDSLAASSRPVTLSSVNPPTGSSTWASKRAHILSRTAW